jgi:hypothetical protein
MEKEEEPKCFESFSQAGQDAFVAAVYGNRREALFVDLGAGDPVEGSNTYALETRLGWRGILADIATKEALEAKRDSGHTIYGDALGLNVMSHIEALASENHSFIEFLSLDLEPPELTLQCLVSLPLDTVDFGIICCEHDRYRRTDSIKGAMEGVLLRRGYQRVAEDIRMIAAEERDWKPFYGLVPVEDWWAHPAHVDVRRAAQIASQIRFQTEYKFHMQCARMNAEEAAR